MHVGVIGAGALGLMAAWQLARAGVRVTVIEREQAVGGLAVNFMLGGAPLERFYHHLFRTDTRMVRLIEELGLRGKLRWGKPPTALRLHEQTHRFDGPVAVLRFPFLPLVDRLRLGLVVAYLKMVRDPARFEGTTAAEWLRRTMGTRAYETVWAPQLRGKMGEYADQVSMAWFWARVHDRTPSLGYLRGGFGQVYERLAAEVRRLGGAVRTGEAVEWIGQREGAVAVRTEHGNEQFDALVVTLPTALFLRLAPDLPADYRARYQQAAPHLGAHNVVLGLTRSVQRAYWLSILDPSYPFLVLVEHTNFLPPSDYGGLHVLYLGNYLPHDHRLFRLSDDETLGELVPALRRLNPQFEERWLREAVVNRALFAQPIVTPGYRERQPPFETPWPNVWLANMGQVYPHDRGQNYSLLLGEAVAARVLASLPALAEARAAAQ
ncbi:MAG: NAD(P)/FAD-dependent oxidoreductase [Chloroflexota bacterium]|nr:NAD(P)/FAD-dependent oxidoreductase [Chloroflexota bacterium]